MFGTANVLQIVLEVKEGDIYTIDTLKKIDAITRTLIETRGVNPFQVTSLTHPSVKNIVITTSGISALPLVRKVPDSQEELQPIRQAVYTAAGVRGVHVSLDDKAALITAGLRAEGRELSYFWVRAGGRWEAFPD